MNNKRLHIIQKAALLAVLLIFAITPFVFAEQQTDTSPELQKKVEVPRITPEELMHRLRMGDKFMIVDVRPLAAFNSRHILGAHSIPLNEIETRIQEFPRDQDIVFY